MRIKIIHFILFYFMINTSQGIGETYKVYDLGFDEVWVVVFEFPREEMVPVVFNENGKFNKKCASKVKKLNVAQLNELNVIINNPESYEDRAEEICYNSYVFVFINKKKVVLTLMPNVLGGDLGALPEQEQPYAWSEHGINQLNYFVNLIKCVSFRKPSDEFPYSYERY